MQHETAERLPVVTIRHRITDQEMVVNLEAYLAGRDDRYADWALASRHPAVEPPSTRTEARLGSALSVGRVEIPPAPNLGRRRRPRKRKPSNKGVPS